MSPVPGEVLGYNRNRAEQGSCPQGADRQVHHYNKMVWGVLLLCGGGEQDAAGAHKGERWTECANVERQG